MIDDSSKTRFEATPTAPIVTSPPGRPIVVEPLIVSIRNKGVVLEDVAIVHAYAWLLRIVVVAAASVKSRRPPVMERFDVDAFVTVRRLRELLNVNPATPPSTVPPLLNCT